MPSFSAELVQRVPLSPRVVGMTFRAAEPFPRAAGQYAMLTLDEGSTHAFSLCAPFAPDEPARFEIAAARGTTAQSLLQLELGSVVSVTGPSGVLVWKTDAPSLLVATGTGISPLRAILLEQLERSSSVPISLLFGCRDAAEELWGAESLRSDPIPTRSPLCWSYRTRARLPAHARARAGARAPRLLVRPHADGQRLHQAAHRARRAARAHSRRKLLRNARASALWSEKSRSDSIN